MFPAGKFEFLEEGAEKSSVNDASTDAVTICEALHVSIYFLMITIHRN